MSLGLAMITNDIEGLNRILKDYGQYFDKYFITVADKNKNKLYELEKLNNEKMVLSYHKWNDNFADARNVNLKTIDTDYWFWLDSDDTLENPERIKDLMQMMINDDLDVVQLKYDYAQNQAGEAISDHWRERMVRTKYICYWHAPVHETLQSKVPANMLRNDWIVVKHQKDKEEVTKSMERNRLILEKHFAETKDPRDAYYLGMTALAIPDPKKAIQWFLQHIKTAGSDEDKYRSWCRIADSEWMLRNFEQALYATDEAIKLRPNFPDAYYIKVLVYTNTEEYEKGIEWLKVASSKPIPDTFNMVDPTLYKYRGMAMGAMCYLFSGQVKEAFRLYQIVIAEAPNFYDEMTKEDGVDWPKMYEEAYYDSKAIDYLKYLLYYMGSNGGKPSKLFESLSPRLYADPRLNAERVKFLPKQKWGEKTISIYCGPAGETWGPDTLEKGMGGSEEAIVYLSRELANLGWSVTVFNDREEEYDDNGVTYKPWTLLNPYDEFNVFVAWRMPENTRNIKAKKRVLDLHDVIPADRIYAMDEEVLIFVKSQYHRSLYPELPDERFVVIGNGIQKEHFV